MTKITMTEAVENLRTLIIEYEDDVYIDDGATNWDIRNLIDVLRVDDDGTLYDLIVCEDAIIELDEDGYRKSIPIMKVKPRPLSDRVEAWDKEDVEQLRNLLAGYDNPEEEGIDLADLPTAQEVPEQIAEYPVWSIDKYGRALVGAAADQIEDLSEILSHYDFVRYSDLPQIVQDYLIDDDTIGPGDFGFLYDDVRREHLTADDLHDEIIYQRDEKGISVPDGVITELEGMNGKHITIRHQTANIEIKYDGENWEYRHPITGQWVQEPKQILTGWSEQDPAEQEEWEIIIRELHNPEIYEWMNQAEDGDTITIQDAGTYKYEEMDKNVHY